MTDISVLTITKADLNDKNEYVGAADITDFDGSILIDAGLGCVRFPESIKTKYSLTAMHGSGIEAGWSIEAGDGIEAGEGIEAGDSIEAGRGIEAGLSITAKWLSVRLRIFSGLCMWRLPLPNEQEIRAEIRSGTVAFGTNIVPQTNSAAEA
jgi:hypothetical protein